MSENSDKSHETDILINQDKSELSSHDSSIQYDEDNDILKSNPLRFISSFL